MQFCDDCGSMMKAEGERMVCTSCGASSDRNRESEFVSTESQTVDDVIEVSGDEELDTKPIATDVVCDECGNREAWYEIRQTASADEPPTRFFKCTECRHVWKGYG